MMPTRRQLVQAGLLGVAGLHWPGVIAQAAGSTVDIRMAGSRNGAAVWFDPVGLLIEPGQTVRWINADAGNSHTATAYHPANGSYPLRIPQGAEPWNSGYLLPDETFSFAFTTEGVYDYFCIPHEMAGMVGRIVVGRPEEREGARDEGMLPDAARRAFPSVADIMAQGAVRRAE